MTPWDEIWQAIDVAVQQGKILYSGSSNFAGWHIAQAQEAAVRRHSFGLVSEQSIYNLTRNVGLEVIPAAQQYGLGLILVTPAGRTAGRGAEERARRRSPRPVPRHPRKAPGTDPPVRGFRRRAGPGTGGRRAGLAAAPARRDRTGCGSPREQLDSLARWTWCSTPGRSSGWTASSGHRTAPEDYA